MPKVSAKRQITIPIDQCQEAHIEPGDIIETYIHNGQITIVKKEAGAAKGIISDLVADYSVSEEDSRQDCIENRRLTDS